VLSVHSMAGKRGGGAEEGAGRVHKNRGEEGVWGERSRGRIEQAAAGGGGGRGGDEGGRWRPSGRAPGSVAGAV
jgi:hypothetical protein